MEQRMDLRNHTTNMKPSICPIYRCAFVREQATEQANASNSQSLAAPQSHCSRATKRRFQSLLAGAFLLRLASSDNEAVGITAFNNSVWPRTDASMGIDSFVVENFEDVTLAAGLQVKVQSPSLGGYGPVSTLPFTFDPSQDLPGGVFNSSVIWDGTRGLLNRPSVPITTYANDGGWSDVSFLFAGGVSSVGFSYGQADANIVIGVDLGSGFTTVFNSITYLPGSGSGYLRIDAGPGETIYGIRLDNQAGNHDGLLYDHLAFQPASSASVPDSAGTSLLLAVSLFALTGLRRRVAGSLPGRQMFFLGAFAFLAFAAAPARAQTIPSLAGFEGNMTGWIPADPVIAAGPIRS